MSGDRGVSLPVAAMGVLAFFLSAALLTNHAFDLLRVGEGESIKERPLAQPPVEARLWEDPLAAVVRHRARLTALCPSGTTPSGTTSSGTTPSGTTPRDEKCPRDGVYGATLEHFSPAALNVVAVLVPGASFIGNEETRRRIRYSVLAGIATNGFVPEYNERLGLLSVPVCPFGYSLETWPDRCLKQTSYSEPFCAIAQKWGVRSNWCADHDKRLQKQDQRTPSVLHIPFETLVADGRRIVVLWLDDSRLDDRWMRQVIAILGTVARDLSPEVLAAARFSIVGPQTSDKLVLALRDIADLSSDTRDAFFCRQWKRVKSLELISPFSTADEQQLIRKATSLISHDAEGICDEKRRGAGLVNGASLNEAFVHQLGRKASQPFFIRAVGSDTLQVELLRDELCARGLGDGQGGRIALLYEWDSIYSRALAIQFGAELVCPGTHPGNVKFERYAYLGGIDGATLEGASPQRRLVPRSGAKGEKVQQPELEWPETRDQRDYVRRLVAHLQGESDSGMDAGRKKPKPVRAIGIIGKDVHDKLILAQALRPAFPERMIFTTDMDARLAHPEVSNYTRNLVVASSLPLALEPSPGAGLHLAPFRDMYQTAVFLSARYVSVSLDQKAGDHSTHVDAHRRAREREEIEKRLSSAYLYEIGRRGEILLAMRTEHSEPEGGKQLAPEPISASQIAERRFYGWMLVGTLILFYAYVFLVRPGPDLKLALRRDSRAELPTILMTGVLLFCFGFAAGVVAELIAPGQFGFVGSILVGIFCTLLFWFVVWLASNERGSSRSALCIVGTIVVAGLLVVASGYPPASAHGTHEPFALFSGVSGWPSELLRTLAILLFGWFVDLTWRGTTVATKDIGKRFFGVGPGQKNAPAVPAKGLRRGWILARRLDPRWLFGWLPNTVVWFWRPSLDPGELRRGKGDGGIDGVQLWGQYMRLLNDGPRLVRLILWAVVAYGFAILVGRLIGGEVPEVPARGIGDRELFLWTIIFAFIASIILMILVSDATILTWRFIKILKEKRTSYPGATLEDHASELGENLFEVAMRPISARPRDRSALRDRQHARNSILDPWIDAKLLADHTEAIAKLIFFPLILLGLLFVARSPIFDNWSSESMVIVVLTAYLLWTIGMATMLNISAEIARRTALEAMAADLLWLKGAGDDYKQLTEVFPSLITQVQELKKGAFAPFFEQPLVRAVLVPLGGAGGLQILELLAFTRS